MANLNKNDIIKIFTLIQAEYSNNKQLDNETLIMRRDIWFAALSEYSKEEVEKAVYKAITTSEFEPRLKTIVDICKRNRNPYTISPSDLWNEVIATLPRIGEAVKDIEMGYDRAWNDYTQKFDSMSYHTRGTLVLNKEFMKLAPETRRYFGNAPERLAALYKMSAEERNYEKARFLKNVQPFIEQQQIATENGIGDYYEQLTNGNKALPDKTEGDEDD